MAFENDEMKDVFSGLDDGLDSNDKTEMLSSKADQDFDTILSEKNEEEKNEEEKSDTDLLVDSELDKEAARDEKRKKKEQKKALKAEMKRIKEEERKEADKNVNIVKELFSLLIYIGAVILFCYLIITFVGQRTTVSGNSMNPTLESGDSIWIDKLTYHFKNPERFDIVVFPYQGQDVYYIKRVIGLPGETVQIDEAGNIFINGTKLDEHYGKDVIRNNGIAGEPITLGADEYFVLGDNRNDSRDSRWSDVGNVRKADIIGRAVFRLAPFKQFGKLK